MSAEDLGRKLMGEVEVARLDEFLHALRIYQAALSPPSWFGIPPLDELIHRSQQHLPPPPDLENVANNVQSHRDHLHGSTHTFRPRDSGFNIKSNVRGTPPIIELTSALPGAGKTHLIYLIIAIAILPPTYEGVELNGKESAVVVIDADGRFDVSRLVQVLKFYIKAQPSPSGIADPTGGLPTTESLSETTLRCLVQSSLQHVHIFRPNSQASLLATLAQLPDYLFDASAHFSVDRSINSIIVDGAASFYWGTRGEEENMKIGVGATDNEKKIPRLQGGESAFSHLKSKEPVDENHEHNVEEQQSVRPPDRAPSVPSPYQHPQPYVPSVTSSYTQLSAHLRMLQRTFYCSVVLTTWSTLAPNGALRPLLPSVIGSLATLRFAVRRKPVPPFAPMMSVEDATKGMVQRQDAVSKGVFEAVVVATAVPDDEYLGGFEFVIRAEGVRVLGEEDDG